MKNIKNSTKKTIEVNEPATCSECDFCKLHYEFGEYYEYCAFDDDAVYKFHEYLMNQTPYKGCPFIRTK